MVVVAILSISMLFVALLLEDESILFRKYLLGQHVTQFGSRCQCKCATSENSAFYPKKCAKVCVHDFKSLITVALLVIFSLLCFFELFLDYI